MNDCPQVQTEAMDINTNACTFLAVWQNNGSVFFNLHISDILLL